MKKLLSDIVFEIKKAVKKEIGSFSEALSSYCQKLDGMMDTLAMITGKIKELKNKNTYLMNQNKHLELKIDVMEQYIRSLEQKQLNNTFELARVPEIKDENTEIILNILATKLNIGKKEITNS
ncbi:unnamed protein product [Parnassius apollo]|uniref:(apollo) hypothetical protein n=1 Tax=Parnassius apollo TaxID=110799 RepID=A0A8S3WU37_PARAO|nr:unnamed protein product [Parnassius apollo]